MSFTGSVYVLSYLRNKARSKLIGGSFHETKNHTSKFQDRLPTDLKTPQTKETFQHNTNRKNVLR